MSRLLKNLDGGDCSSSLLAEEKERARVLWEVWRKERDEINERERDDNDNIVQAYKDYRDSCCRSNREKKVKRELIVRAK